jgi:REP element-mobilizing transposase RayT
MSFTRRHLPHWIPDNSIIVVTWRVADASSLADPRCARVVANALIYGTKMYDLHAWAVMPTHVHAVMTPKRPFPEIMRWLKGTDARRCNRLLGKKGAFWQDESFDHWIRNGREMEGLIAYVEENPIAAGLKNWPWSSKTVGQAILSPVID